ncbi:MAG: asparagine synthase C-terminal domain-containing protein [Bacteroidetes bacterium]|nr:asparagine synthase C-terminal domain-containing protein [Bacteroidota bacterium]
MKSEKEISDSIYQTLEKSVAYRMVADVPVGAFLSGGVDSSAIVALMSRLNTTPVKTYSVGFKDQPDYDEKSYAHRIAEMFQSEHHEVNIDAGDMLTVFHSSLTALTNRWPTLHVYPFIFCRN